MRKFLTSIFEKLAEKLKEKDTRTVVLEENDVNYLDKPREKKTPKKRKQKEKKEKTSIGLTKDSLLSISPQKMKLISVAGDIRLDPDKTESAFMARLYISWIFVW